MNHPIENRYRYGLVYNLDGQIVGFNLSPDVFVGLTDEEIESALEAYVKRKHELPSVQPEQKWIPVSERLPEEGQNVLFCDVDEDIMLGYHIKSRPDTHFSENGSWEDMKNVRAWMPLPEPYVPDIHVGKMEEGD